MLGSKIMSFGLGSFSQRISRFVPSVLTRTVSQSFNRMVSKVVPQKEEDLLHLDESAYLPSFDADDTRRI